MKRTCKILLSVYLLILALTLLTIGLYESDVLESGLLAHDKQSEFLLLSLMELLSLGAAFLGLRLFKFQKVHADLVAREAPALLKWGLIRLLVLELPMLVNTLLYYIYMNTTFGYLAIILLLCLPFVFPTMGRCLAETSEDEE